MWEKLMNLIEKEIEKEERKREVFFGNYMREYNDVKAWGNTQLEESYIKLLESYAKIAFSKRIIKLMKEIEKEEVKK